MPKSKTHVYSALSYSFGENAYIAYIDKSKDCIVVDPGIDTDQLLGRLFEKDLTPTAILVTHGHYDHIGGIPALREKWPGCPIMTSAREAEKLVNPRLNLSADFGVPHIVSPADRLLEPGEEFEVAGIAIKVLQIPGHSCGHLAFLLRDTEPLEVFVGDTIFLGSIGRGDFPDGDSNQLIEELRSQILTLPDDTILYPGHGPKTTVGREKRSNPFLR